MDTISKPSAGVRAYRHAPACQLAPFTRLLRPHQSEQCLHWLQVPYHPVVAYLWGAHTNIQVVTNAAWSFYMLKYALKVRPPSAALPGLRRDV